MTDEIDARMLRVDESLAKQLERSIQRNCEYAGLIDKLKNRIEITPHEREAMYELVQVVRALVIVTGIDGPQKNATLNWAQMVEDVVDRLDNVGR